MSVKNLTNILIWAIWIILIPTISVLLDIYFNINGIVRWLIVSIIAIHLCISFSEKTQNKDILICFVKKP